jgi:hypothetical protein
VTNEVHTFVVDDQDHPQMIEICAELKRLSGLMYDVEYVPYILNLCYMTWKKKKKVFHLCYHRKKLAVEFGLINTAPGTQLQIIKDQRVCEDFHTSTKFISKILRRVIMVRDVNQFHHFEDGICSHMDYIVDVSSLYLSFTSSSSFCL